MCLQGCNAAQFDAELARFAAVVSELLMFGLDLEAPSAQVGFRPHMHNKR